MPEETKREILIRLLDSQTTGVLATENDHQPYANLVAFSFTVDLKRIIFATPNQTTKYRNLIENPKVSLIIDSRKNNPENFSGSMAVTAVGLAMEITGEARSNRLREHAKRLPGLSGFLDSLSIALFEIDVETYVMAMGLDDVSVFRFCDD